MFDNRVFKRILWFNTSEVTWCWRRLPIEEFKDVNSSTYIIRVIKSSRMRWVGSVTRMGDRRGAYTVLMVKTEVKGTFRKPRHRREDNIKMNLEE